jgi:hypothetical protein
VRLKNSGLADNIAESDLFPLIESVHMLAICLVAGSILAVDLRLVGLALTDRPAFLGQCSCRFLIVT